MTISTRHIRDNRFLYRYQRIPRNQKRLERLLINNEMYFPSPATFNDPFDCKADFNYEGCLTKDLEAYLIKACSYLGTEITEKRKEICRSNPDWFQHHNRYLFSKFIQPRIDKMAVLCLSKKRDDILMWSHYAAGHKGFCLEFDKKVLKSHLVVKPVRYKQPYLSFKDVNPAIPYNKEKQIELLLLRKSMHWKYEREWRAIFNPAQRRDKKGSRYLKLPDVALTGIIFGCAISKSDKETVISLLAKRASIIKKYEAEKNKDEFALKINEINE